MSKALILIELNEINFDLVRDDPRLKDYRNLKRLLANHEVHTSSEKEYEQLEPWIQWASVHTGRTLAEHGVFRLGDMAEAQQPQFFEKLESKGFKVGAISPMNAANRLQNPAYFVPDPWTRTPPDGSFLSRILTPAVQQAVNDNSEGRLTIKTLMSLLAAFVVFAQPKNWMTYFKMAASSRGKSWRKALVLDLLLHDIHLKMCKSKRPQFSTLFLNAGAHIQHHYFFNYEPVRNSANINNPAWYIDGNADPMRELLAVYDRIIGDYLRYSDAELLVATGLSQVPYDKVQFYYRIRNHEQLLTKLGVPFSEVLPRMTRDFLVRFPSREACLAGRNILSSVMEKSTQTPIFGEIDDRGDSLFVTLTYGDEIASGNAATWPQGEIDLHEEVVFVAIKNGMHSEKGFAFFSKNIAKHAPQSGQHVATLHDSVMNYFSAPEIN